MPFGCGDDKAGLSCAYYLAVEGYQAFYLAIGAQGGRPLGIDGENAENVISGVEFSRGVNQGKGKKDTVRVSADTVLLSIGQSIEWGGLLKNTKVKTGRGNNYALSYVNMNPNKRGIII